MPLKATGTLNTKRRKRRARLLSPARGLKMNEEASYKRGTTGIRIGESFGDKEIPDNYGRYLERQALYKSFGYDVFGGTNAPYIWLKTPRNLSSWDFFDELLSKVQVVGTPGSGFGPSGEGYFRLSAFGSKENVIEAMERIKGL